MDKLLEINKLTNEIQTKALNLKRLLSESTDIEYINLKLFDYNLNKFEESIYTIIGISDSERLYKQIYN
jgi:hypothetical protein